jgi:hypothetical protein
VIYPVVGAAFADELLKIAAARKNMTVAQSRKGRRPMHVSTMLKKEKDGTLFKYTKGQEKKAGSEGSEQASLLYSEGASRTGDRAKPKAKPGDVPSREGDTKSVKAENRQDARGTILKGGFPETDAVNHPSEGVYG